MTRIMTHLMTHMPKARQLLRHFSILSQSRLCRVLRRITTVAFLQDRLSVDFDFKRV